MNDPLSLTIGADTVEFNRVAPGNNIANYLHKGDGFEISIVVRSSYETSKPGQTQMERHNLDMKKTEFSPDGTTQVLQVYSVLRVPRGRPVADIVALGTAQAGLVGSSVNDIVMWDA